MRAAAIAISGWAFGAESLQPLAAALGPGMALEILAPADLSGADCAEQTLETLETNWAYAEGLRRRIAGPGSPAVLIGWSMGAVIALEAALLEPQSIAALVLVSGTARFCRAPGYPAGMPASLVEAMLARLAAQPEAVVHDFIGRVFLPDAVDERERQALAASALRQGPAVLARGLRYLAATDLRADLGRVGCPILLLHGDRDRVVPAAASDHLLRVLPASRLETIPGAGHALPLRHAGEIGARTLAFLRGLPPP